VGVYTFRGKRYLGVAKSPLKNLKDLYFYSFYRKQIYQTKNIILCVTDIDYFDFIKVSLKSELSIKICKSINKLSNIKSPKEVIKRRIHICDKWIRIPSNRNKTSVSNGSGYVSSSVTMINFITVSTLKCE
jgi:hypothetical protein